MIIYYVQSAMTSRLNVVICRSRRSMFGISLLRLVTRLMPCLCLPMVVVRSSSEVSPNQSANQYHDTCSINMQIELKIKVKVKDLD